MNSSSRTARLSFSALVLLAYATTSCLEAAPVLAIARSGSSDVTISWFGESGISYQLQSNTNLAAWTDLGGPVTGANATVTVTVTMSAKPKAFFRLKPPPADVITAVFVPASGVFTVTGGNNDNAITVSRDAVGILRVNGGAVTITGGTPSVANTVRIDLFGRAGDDQLVLDESNGALPAARV